MRADVPVVARWCGGSRYSTGSISAVSPTELGAEVLGLAVADAVFRGPQGPNAAKPAS
jgi:hypothetical protein